MIDLVSFFNIKGLKPELIIHDNYRDVLDGGDVVVEQLVMERFVSNENLQCNRKPVERLEDRSDVVMGAGTC